VLKKPLAGCSKGQIREFALHDLNGLERFERLEQSNLEESEAFERQRSNWVFFSSLPV
jgi:hypothetical protein